MREVRRGRRRLALKLTLQDTQGCIYIIDKLKQSQVCLVNDSMTHQSLEVDDFPPIGGTEEEDGDPARQLLRLRECQELQNLIQGAEPAGKRDECPSQMREPELAHEKI